MEEKSREEILAERKLRKAAKQAKKKGPPKTQNESQSNDNIELDFACVNFDEKKISVVADVTSEDVPPSDSKKSPVSRDTIDFRPANIHKQDTVEEETLISSKAEKMIEEKNTENNSDGGKSKAQLRAERRAKQDAQRALKVQKKSDEQVAEKKEKVSTKVDTKKVPSKSKTIDRVTKSNDPHKIKLFCHLYRNTSVEEDQAVSNNPDIHKAIVKLGVQYKNKVIIGSNARVIALLNALKQVLSDHKTPAEKDFSRGFELVLAQSMSHLDNCRSSSVSMINAVKFLKSSLSQLPNNITDHEAQIKLREVIDDYIKEQIDKAGEAICMMVRNKISEDDVILTFGYSSLIERILLESHHVGIKFRVIIVDAGPLYEGKELLRRLVKNKLDCTYVLLSAASYIMKEANKVLLGAHALLTNGYVMSRAGSSQVALIAKSYNVPVLVCCETHKFSERVQTDAFVHNELGDGEKLMKADKWKNNQYLTPLTLMYDVTPSDLVTAVITELAILPCTSVPVVLRVKPASSTSL